VDVAGGIFFAVFAIVWLALMIYWIIAIVEVCRLPEQQYRAAFTEKTVWIIVVVVAGFVGALVWRFAKRKQVIAAAGTIPPPPAGWYPESATGGLRWWDGRSWSDVRHVPPS
jgi:hypothetical protein